MPLSGLRVTQSHDPVRPFGLCRNHGSLFERVSSFADPVFAKTDFRVWTCAIPWFDTLTVESDVRLVAWRGKLSENAEACRHSLTYFRQNGHSAV